MKVREFLNLIDSFAPFDLAEEWDNSGLMVGSYESDVKKIGITLDPVFEAVISASENNCEVLLTHHPLLFRAIKKIDFDSEPGKTISEAVKRNITIISAHTNWDISEYGVNYVLAKLSGLFEVKNFNSENIGVIGTLKNPLSPEELLTRIKTSWNLTKLDFYAKNNVKKFFSKIAICGGSGASFWRAAKNSGADIYITADMKYHELIDANNSDLPVALADHGEMERATLPELAGKISESNNNLEAILLNINALNLPIRF